MRWGRGTIVAGIMAGRTPRELAQEFGLLRRLNPRLRKAVMHFAISPAPGDPEFSDAQWDYLAHRFVKALGYDKSPWVAFVHRDTDHVHMHIMTSRIDLNGRTVSNFNDFRKAEQVMRDMEAELGLRSVPGTHTPSPSEVPKPRRFGKQSQPNAKRQKPPNSKQQGDNTMDDNAITQNPFQPGDPQYDTWPQPFEPGRDNALAAFVDAHPELMQNGAAIWPELEEKDGRNMRRRIVDRDYETRIRRVLGDDLTRVHKHANGATLYFRQRGELRDSGHTILASGMDEKLAAQRIVALGFERGWKAITFTGTGEFIEHAMRQAMHGGMTIHAQGEAQAAILAKVIAERQGGMGSMAGPSAATQASIDPLLVDPILAPLLELDGLTPGTPAQTLIRTVPPAAPMALPPAPADTPETLADMTGYPVHAPLQDMYAIKPIRASPTPIPAPAKPAPGLLATTVPPFRNLSERLQQRRDADAQIRRNGRTDAPVEKSKAPGRP